jgi:hypothetical protein
MIALPQRLPHIIWKNDRLVPLSEGWLAESIEHAAAAAGHPRWHLAPEVARAIAVYLENDWVAPSLPLSHLNEMVRRSLEGIGFGDIATESHIVPPRRVGGAGCGREAGGTTRLHQDPRCRRSLAPDLRAHQRRDHPLLPLLHAPLDVLRGGFGDSVGIRQGLTHFAESFPERKRARRVAPKRDTPRGSPGLRIRPVKRALPTSHQGGGIPAPCAAHSGFVVPWACAGLRYGRRFLLERSRPSCRLFSSGRISFRVIYVRIFAQPKGCQSCGDLAPTRPP